MKKTESQTQNEQAIPPVATPELAAEDSALAADQTGGEELPTAVELSTLSPEQFEELKSRAAKADEYWDRLLRTTADFENFRKRAARERQDSIRYANEALMQKLITVLDNFEMAQSAAQSGTADSLQAFQEGVSMIYQQLRGVLTEAGLEELDATGQKFDPNFHEAVSQQESADVPEGQVLQQLRKGYKLRERLLRPASVVVAKPPAGA
ncbi:MAG: nucleotide exchange factor GrpE [Verrucomicrobia bacterium]|nr:nucleotide exchange factor GrpE [Verrucomicrobiota bacterium]